MWGMSAMFFLPPTPFPDHLHPLLLSTTSSLASLHCISSHVAHKWIKLRESTLRIYSICSADIWKRGLFLFFKTKHLQYLTKVHLSWHVFLFQMCISSSSTQILRPTEHSVKVRLNSALREILFNSAKEVMFSPALVGLTVRLSVSRITQQSVDRILWNLACK